MGATRGSPRKKRRRVAAVQNSGVCMTSIRQDWLIEPVGEAVKEGASCFSTQRARRGITVRSKERNAPYQLLANLLNLRFGGPELL